MRIALVTRSMCGGGTERVAAQLSLLWTEAGCAIILLTRQEETINDYRHLCIARESSNGMEWEPQAFRAACEKHMVDIAVFNGSWNDESFKPLVRECRSIGIKVVTVLHHAFDNWAFSLCNAGDFDKTDILPSIDCLVCVDKIQALWWSRRHPCVVCIENPVSIVGSQPLLSNAKQNNVSARCAGKEIVWLGRANDNGKRVELAFDAFNGISAKEAGARLTVIGAIGAAKKKALLYRLSEKARERVTFTGYITDIRPYLESAAVNMVTTLWEVTVPQVILEAQSMGVSTVALNLPVLRGVEGLRCVASTKEMVEAVLEVIALGAGKERRPLVDVESRNHEVVKKWESLFTALSQCRISMLSEDWSREWRTIENAELLIDEIQRSEAFIVENHVPTMNRIRRWKAKWAHLKQMVGL